jgi:hypothetical protein|nr:class I SAM-dependent methyltransferase [Methanoculleus marisnigri]
MLADLPARPKILDIGCGAGMQTVELARTCPDCRITAADDIQEACHEGEALKSHAVVSITPRSLIAFVLMLYPGAMAAPATRAIMNWAGSRKSSIPAVVRLLSVRSVPRMVRG